MTWPSMPDPATFHFIRPAWLWLLLGVAMMPLGVYLRDRWSRASAEGFVEPHLLKHLIVPAGRRGWFRPIYVATLTAFIGVVAGAGPAWERERPPFSEDKAPMVIVVETSWSMNAIDVTPTRLKRAAQKVSAILAARAGARTALVAYAGTAHVVMPFTDDASAIEMFLPGLDPSVMPVDGDDPGAALAIADRMLDKEQVPGSILLLTDGVPEARLDRFVQTRDKRRQLLVLGVGTSAGGPIRTGDNQFRTGPSGARVVARLDKASLEALGSRAGAVVATITVDDRDVTQMQRSAQRHMQDVQAREQQARWKDAGYYLTFPVIAMAALWFRKGWTVRWATMGLVLALWPSSAHAQEPASANRFTFMDLWLTRDQQGRRLFDRGDFKGAAALFDDPMWKGVACYRAGDLRCAVDAFARLQSPDANYDLGNALARQGEYKLAVAAYDQALAGRAGFVNAAANRDLVLKAMRKPKPKEEEQEEAPDMKPDKVQYDEKGKKGKKGQVDQLMEQKAIVTDAWLKSVQSGPGDFLRMKFAIEAKEGQTR